MTSGEERLALENLRALLASDLSKADVDELLGGISQSKVVADNVQTWMGRLVAELRRRDVPWSKITQATGMPKATLDRYAGRIE